MQKEGVSQKSEESLSLAEVELDKNSRVIEDLTRTVHELQETADEAATLKDKLDEYVLRVLYYHTSLLLIDGDPQVQACCRTIAEDGECHGEIQEETAGEGRPQGSGQGMHAPEYSCHVN